ncbi:DNA polymerase III subunit chi [Sphingomonas montanisoli]|uniref:DNA polymerase III subunit chi n=1 Tax=Sphingomonas montanisoli TaxID=2606412 RepID=A0A5D9CFR7_9SPHN|nr:DNA polymerase III subunit chi [Sphingomonas montanisoli]TZG28991.1 DNA polymerase III subunit chi [Sphingomonas montanisoli]
MQVDFYHLTRLPLDRVLPRIAERVLETGGRLLVVAEDDALAEKIDEALWINTPDSFLPHARVGGDDALQPVLIASDVAAGNGARNVALADGIWRDEAIDFDRAFYFFDAESIAGARTAWRALAGREGIEPRYWKQDEQGRWKIGP